MSISGMIFVIKELKLDCECSRSSASCAGISIGTLAGSISIVPRNVPTICQVNTWMCASIYIDTNYHVIGTFLPS